MNMKRIIQTLTALMGLATVSTLAALAGAQPTPAPTPFGNQLMRNQTHWYEKAAETVGPAEGVSFEGGSLLVLKTGSYLYLEGNSTLHKYQMRAGTLKGSAIPPQGKDLLAALKSGEVRSMSLVIPLRDFKSRESGLDDNAYKALKAQENPEIKFTLVKVVLQAGERENDFVMTAEGNLTVAGNTIPVTLAADASVTGNKVEFKGIQKLKMSDFKITPPSISLLVASITCTDEIEIHYDVVFEARK